MRFQRRLQVRALVVLLLAGLALVTTPKRAMANPYCPGQPNYCFPTCIDGVWDTQCPIGQEPICYPFNYVCDEFECPNLVVCNVE